MNEALSGDEAGGWEAVNQKDNQMLGISNDLTKVHMRLYCFFPRVLHEIFLCYNAQVL
jgi:hypothetical protein